MGLEVGDIAAVIFRDRVEFAFFADVGDPRKIGEGSIALAQVGRSIPGDVIYIVFPWLRIAGLTPTNVVQRVRERDRQFFTAAGGRLPP